MARDPERLWRAFHPPAEFYDIRDTTAFAVTLASRALRGYLTADRMELGLHEGRDLVLLEISRLAGRATVRDLVESLGVTAGSVSAVVRRLEGAGYVRREHDPHDGRVWLLAPTEEGEASVFGAAALWRDADDALRLELSAPSMEWLRTLSVEARSAWLKARAGKGAGDAAGGAARGAARGAAGGAARGAARGDAGDWSTLRREHDSR